MAKVELKTTENNSSVEEFLDKILDEKKRKQSFELLELFRTITGEKGKMWGSSIIGFGKYEYKYASGREGEWMVTGFSPRKANLTIYIMPGYDLAKDKLEKLGPYKNGKSCLYIKDLAEIDMQVLEELIRFGLQELAKKHKVQIGQ